MIDRFPSFLLLFILVFSPGGAATAQEKEDDAPGEVPEPQSTSIGIPVKLDISRRYLKNFLTDPVALIPYETEEEDSARDLEGAFMMGSPSARYAVIWDPVSCRLLGVLDLKAPKPPAKAPEDDASDENSDEKEQKEEVLQPSPYVLLAEGPPPLQDSAGAFGSPQYFGFRVIEGKPEFLYVHGGLVVEERIWLEQDGNVLKQRFSIRKSESDVTLQFPAHWKERASSEAGTWKDATLSVPSENAQDITLSYLLSEPTPDAKEEN